MIPLGRFLIFLGILCVILGFLLSYTNVFSYLKHGRLPGDIWIKRENFQFYFPITTPILLSLVLALIVCLIRK